MEFRKKKFIIIIFLILFFVLFLYLENNTLSVTKLDIKSERLPNNFRDYKIVHLSDLHSKSFGDNQKYLVNKIKKIKPDIIFFTGDLVDSKKYNEEVSVTLLEQLVDISPVCFVTGNHEWWSGKFDSLEKRLIDIGVNVLRNEKIEVIRNNDKINILGIDDPYAHYTNNNNAYSFIDRLKNLKKDIPKEDFNILLSHRPELFSLYNNEEIDLIFSGHAHGGQFRIPFVGGIISPDQGFLPKYTNGIYKDSKSTLVVSSGLGNSIIPQRIFNRPEIIIVTLKK